MRLFALKMTIWVLFIGLLIGTNAACGRKGDLVLPDNVADNTAAEKNATEEQDKDKEKEKAKPKPSATPQ